MISLKDERLEQQKYWINITLLLILYDYVKHLRNAHLYFLLGLMRPSLHFFAVYFIFSLGCYDSCKLLCGLELVSLVKTIFNQNKQFSVDWNA